MYAEAGDRIAQSVSKHASYLPRFIFAIDNVSHAGYIYFSGQISFFVFLVVIEVAVDKDFGSAHHFAPTISVTPIATSVAPSIPTSRNVSQGFLLTFNRVAEVIASPGRVLSNPEEPVDGTLVTDLIP